MSSFQFGNFNAPDMDDQEIDQKKVAQASSVRVNPNVQTQQRLDPAGPVNMSQEEVNQPQGGNTNQQTGQLSSAGLLAGQDFSSFGATRGQYYDPVSGSMQSIQGVPSGAQDVPDEEKVDPLGDLNWMKEGFEQKLEDLWGQSRELQQNQMAYNNSRANEIAGRMSSSVGGGYRGAQAQAELNNLQALKQHELDWGSMGLDFENNWINQSIGQLGRQEAMDWEKERFGKQNTADLFNMYNELEIDIPFEQFIQIMDDPAMGQQFLDEAAEKKRQAENTARDIKRELGFDPESLNATAYAAYEAYLKNPNDETKAALEEALEGSKEDSDFESRKQAAMKDFKNIVPDINDTRDVQANQIYNDMKDAQTPEQLEKAVERAKDWKAIKRLRQMKKSGVNIDEDYYRDLLDDYNAKWGQNVGYGV